jgi:tetratricopeptide (TPR) repeat protein
VTDYYLESMYSLNKKGQYEDLIKEIRLDSVEELLLAVNAYIHLKQEDKAINQLEMWRDRFITKREEALYIENLGRCYYYKGEFDKAEAEFKKLSKLLDEVQDARMEIHLKLKLAKIYIQKGQTEEVEKIVFEALNDLDKIGDKLHLAEAHKDAGKIFAQLNMKEKAIESFTTAMDLFKQLGNDYHVQSCLEYIESVQTNNFIL